MDFTKSPFIGSPFIGSPFIGSKFIAHRHSAWNPLLLFSSGELGILISLSIASVFEDSAGTTPASVNGPVGLVKDASGHGFDLVQETSLSKPTLRQDVGGNYSIQFDRVDDNLSVMIPAGGIQGSMILGTTEGIVVAEVDIPEGEWDLVKVQYSGLYFPPGYFVGLILRQGVMSASEIAQAKNWLISRGAKLDFGTSTYLIYTLGKRPEIITVDTSYWDTKKVTDFQIFAYDCSSLQTLDVSNWNTSKVTSFQSFANSCRSLQTLDVSNWNTSKVTNFNSFAYDCSSLQTLDVSNWNTSEVNYFQYFVRGCTSLTLDVSNWAQGR